MGREKEKRRKSEAQLASECERGSPGGTCSSWQGSGGGATSREWGSATRVRRSRTSKTRLDLQRGWGEYGEVTYTNSPDCLLNRGSFRSFGYASLVWRCPTPRWWRRPQTPARRNKFPDDACRHRLDSHARIRSLIALRFFFFFLFLSPLPTPH